MAPSRKYLKLCAKVIRVEHASVSFRALLAFGSSGDIMREFGEDREREREGYKSLINIPRYSSRFLNSQRKFGDSFVRGTCCSVLAGLTSPAILPFEKGETPNFLLWIPLGHRHSGETWFLPRPATVVRSFSYQLLFRSHQDQARSLTAALVARRIGFFAGVPMTKGHPNDWILKLRWMPGLFPNECKHESVLEDAARRLQDNPKLSAKALSAFAALDTLDADMCLKKRFLFHLFFASVSDEEPTEGRTDGTSEFAGYPREVFSAVSSSYKNL